MTVLNRKLITRMVNPQPGGNGGGNSYVPQSQAVSWTDIDGKPTTLAGYGITDAYWATTQSTSDKRNLTIGSVTQQVITAHQSLYGYATEYWVGQQGYATQSWVGQQGYLTSSALSGYATQTWVGQQGFATQTWVGNNYLPLTGGTVTGDLTVNQTFTCQSVEIGHTNEVNATGSSNLYLQYRNSGNLVLCYNGQNVGIGVANPAYKLEVAGNCRISTKLLVATTDSTYELNVGGTIYATGSITERSDIRCKDVETYQWSPTLDMIADAPIIRYTMKDDKTHRMRVGSVAQYWEKVIPEAVSKDNEGILSIAQGDICMVNIIALAREVRKLREEIIQLKKWA